jgi:hypothetical protein
VLAWRNLARSFFFFIVLPLFTFKIENWWLSRLFDNACNVPLWYEQRRLAPTALVELERERARRF